MTRRLISAVSFALLASAIPVAAHHSAASAYSTAKKVTMKGTVTKVEWKNPHVFYYLDVADPCRDGGQLGHRRVNAEPVVQEWLAQGQPER